MTETISHSSLVKSETKGRLVRLGELDGLRGAAALMVFFHHVCFTSINPNQWEGGIRVLHSASAFGFAGVNVFFVLSGFLITKLLIEDRSSPAYYKNFYWKRALRILPLYVICLLAVYLFVPGSAGYVLLCALFISNFSQLFHITSNGPFWTLAIEEQFYLLWPTVVRRRSIAQIAQLALAIGISCIALRFIAASTGHHNFRFTFFCCDGLAMGAFLACRFKKSNQDTPGRIVFHLLPMFVCAVLAISASQLLPPTLRGQAFADAFLHTGLTLLSGAMVGYLITHTGARTLGLLRFGPLPFFGAISYALYMTHLYILQAYDRIFGPLTGGDALAYWLRFFTVLAVTVALCVVVRYLVELPAASLRKYVLSPPLLVGSLQALSPESEQADANNPQAGLDSPGYCAGRVSPVTRVPTPVEP